MTARLSEYDVYPVAISDIYYDESFNCRNAFTLDSVAELAESIRQHGLKFPIVVQPWDQQPGYAYRLVAGHRRFRAMQAHLKADTIPARVAHNLDEHEARKLNLLENLERKDLNILEEAQGMRRLFPTQGRDVIVRELGRPDRWVYTRLRLLTLPEPVQQMAAAGLILKVDIEALDRIQSPDAQIRAAEKIAAGRRENPKRRPRLGLTYTKVPRGVRTKNAINRMIARMLAEGITGLAPRVAAWCANQITEDELLADIRQEVVNRHGANYAFRDNEVGHEAGNRLTTSAAQDGGGDPS